MIKNMALRLADGIQKRYAAGKVGNDGWMPTSESDAELIRKSKGLVSRRINALTRDMPYFARAINVIQDYKIGAGTILQCQVRDENGKLLDKINTKIEDHWKWWCEQSDISGRNHFADDERLVSSEETKEGEFLVLKCVSKTGRNKFRINVINTQRLTEFGVKPAAGNQIYMGVEYDKLTGAPVAYHIAQDGYISTPVRVPANNVLHGFTRKTPGQMRGMSKFTAGVMLARDLDDYMGSELDAAKMAAKWMAFVETPDPSGKQLINGVQKGADGSKIERMRNAIIEYLRPGEKVSFNAAVRNSEGFERMAKFILRTWAIMEGISYELLTGDYQGLNYSSLRGIRNDLGMGFYPMQVQHMRRFVNPIYREWLQWEVMSGGLDLPGYFQNPYMYYAIDGIGPHMPNVDPLREGKADIQDIQAGLKSPQEVIKGRGGDPDTVLAQCEEWKRKCDEKGLAFDLAMIDTAMESHPAKITGESENA
ncbi:phage portal protein [Seleniivibrio woodruffii]|uniref:phage portal protein n=1 Tax=Seleniivibrio woodruffii TaxID=1078050 RepID=UPI00240A58A2|nr:phage portal protein [Seleniivibrio woodruffii]